MSRDAAISGLVALAGVGITAVWLASFCVPSLLGREDLARMYQATLCLGVLVLPIAAAWRWWVGAKWHATAALWVGVVALGSNGCGFAAAVVMTLGQL